MTTKSPSITARQATPAGVEADALVVGIQPEGTSIRMAAGAESVEAAFGGTLVATLTTLGAKGKPDEVTLVPSGGAVTAPLVVAVGLGDGTPTTEAIRRAAGSVVRRLDGQVESLAFVLVADDAQPATSSAPALAEGVLLGAYRFDRYRGANNDRRELQTVELIHDGQVDAAVTTGIRAVETCARAVRLARDWVNIPPSDLYPESFATAAKTEAERVGVTFDVLDDEALKAAGYGGIVGVGQGSVRGPRLVSVSYRHPEARKKLAFVGKGITFDSGGLSLKPTDGMKTMKCDMGGAAAVLAAVLAIAELELPVEVTAWAALAENMPSGTAQRPSDVLTMYGGKTVEVLNTDAEGRLVLADALVRACEDEPDVVVDVATLTGAAVIALGDRTYGIMGNDTALRTAIWEAAERAGEDAWPLPIPENMREKIDSKVADIANVGSTRYGGALSAAAFLRDFVADGIAWAHLDIAGPAFNENSPWGYTPVGGTGSGVRTLVELARTF